jgi:myo-inositol-1(or 4)-monophosphatase
VKPRGSEPPSRTTTRRRGQGLRGRLGLARSRAATAPGEGEQSGALPRGPLDTRTLVRLAKRAGGIALGHFRRATAETKADETLVTAADREVETFLRSEIARLDPGIALLGEEFPASGDPRAGFAAALDPIDGTEAFVAGLPTWSISLGVLLRGAPHSGVVYLPAFDDVYVVSGGVLHWNGTPVPRGGVPPQQEGFVLAYSEFHRRHLLRFGPGTRRVRALGSTAYHLSLVARGAAEGAIIGRVHVWDIAAGLALLHAVGGELVYLRSGKPVELEPLLDGEPTRDLLVAARLGATERVLRSIGRR